MKKILLSAFIALSMFGTAALSNAASDKKVYRISFASYLMDKDPVVQQVYKPWLKEIEKRSNGRLKCTFYNPNTICNEGEILEAVEKGRVTIGTQNLGRNPGRFPINVLFSNGLTGCTTSKSGTSGYYRMMEAEQEMREKLSAEYSGMKILWFHTTGCPSIHTAGKQVKTIDDLKGLRIFCPGAAAVHILTLMGGKGTQLPMSDFYLSIQRKIGDGCMADENMLTVLKLYEVTKYSVIYGNPSASCAAFINLDFYNSLPKDLQKIIEETTGEQMAMKIADATDITCANQRAELQKKGQVYYIVPQADRKPFLDAVFEAFRTINKPLYEKGYPVDKYVQTAYRYCQEGEKKYGLK